MVSRLNSLWRRIAWCGVAALTGFTAPAAVAADVDMTPTTVRMGLFTRNLALFAAQDKGFFAKQQLKVEYLQVKSSVQQFQSVRDGEYDVIMTSPDNVANYRVNPKNAAGGTLDVRVIMGGDYGVNLSLAALPQYKKVTDLRGKKLAVDSPVSGFAFVLYKIMRAHGLERGKDYTIVEAGGTPKRFSALRAGEFDATLLNNGFELRAANAGHPLLAKVYDVANPYLGGVLAARADWLERNDAVAVRLIRALHEAARWGLDPANREEAIAMLMKQPNTPRELAEQMYNVQVTPGVGLVPDVSVDRKALRNVLQLRDEFGGFQMKQNLSQLVTSASGLYELRYHRKALGTKAAAAQ